MLRIASLGLVLTGLSGCIAIEPGPEGGIAPGSFGVGMRQPQIPGIQGPHGQSVPVHGVYAHGPRPASEYQTRQMMQNHVPLNMVQIHHPDSAMQVGMTAPGALPPQMRMPPGGIITPPGMPFAPGAPGNTMANFPQQAGLMPPGGPMGPGGPMPPGGMSGMMPPMMPQNPMMPPGGMSGMPMPPMMPPGAMSGMPGPQNPALPPGGMNPPIFGMREGSMQPIAPGMNGGIMQAQYSPDTGGDEGVAQAGYPPGVVAAMGAMPPNEGVRFSVERTQVRFMRPSGMKIAWFTRGANGQPAYSSTPIEAPGRYNFQQGAVYRLKLSNIEGRPGLEIYPTLEVVPVNTKTEAFLAHSAVPVDFTDEDFNQIVQGNFVIKVVYLPDSQFQEFAGAGIDTILSTQLEPGADPIQEALRRGSILLVIRMGNVDQEARNTPPLGAASAQNGQTASGQGMSAEGHDLNGRCPPPMVPYILPPGMTPPPGMMPPGMMPPFGAMQPNPQPAQPPADKKMEVGGRQDQTNLQPNVPMTPPGGLPLLVPPPSNAMVTPRNVPSAPTELTSPPADTLTQPKETPGTLTGRGRPPEMPPEVGPQPTQLPEVSPETNLPPTSAPQKQQPELHVPDDLLNALPPGNEPSSRTPGGPALSPTEGVPPAGATVPQAPTMDEGPPAVMPANNQGTLLQRIGFTRPKQRRGW